MGARERPARSSAPTSGQKGGECDDGREAGRLEAIYQGECEESTKSGPGETRGVETAGAVRVCGEDERGGEPTEEERR